MIIQNEEILADYKEIVQQKIIECKETIKRLKPRDRWKVTLLKQREEELKLKTLKEFDNMTNLQKMKILKE